MYNIWYKRTSRGTVATYHDIHYGTFHIGLPHLVLSESFGDFVDALLEHKLPELLTGVWAQVATTLNNGKKPSVGQLVSPSDFQIFIDEPDPDWTTVLIVTPKVMGGLEAAMVAVLFNDELKSKPLYFTCEAPAIAGSPFMIGQLKGAGDRSNLGPMFDLSIDAMFAFVRGRVPRIPDVSVQQIPHAGQRTLLEVPDIDAILRMSDESAESSNPLSGNARIGEESNQQNYSANALRNHLPRVSGPIHFGQAWSAQPHELASEALTNLYRLAQLGGSALVMSTKKAKGLGRKVSSYVQFMWTDDGLLVEIQGDYSYWGLAISSQYWPRFEVSGMSIPTGGIGNFMRVIPVSASHDQRLQALTDVFSAFALVLEPSGKISVSHF